MVLLLGEGPVSYKVCEGGIGGYEYFAKVPRGGGHPFLQQ